MLSGFVDVDRYYSIKKGDPHMYCYKDESQVSEFIVNPK